MGATDYLENIERLVCSCFKVDYVFRPGEFSVKYEAEELMGGYYW